MGKQQIQIHLNNVEISELRISHGTAGFVLTFPTDSQPELDFNELCEIAGSEEYDFKIDMTAEWDEE